MPKATTRIQHRPLNERDQKAKDTAKTFEVGDDVPKDIADQVPGAVDASSKEPKEGDFTSDDAVKRSITHAPDHPDRPLNIPGEHEWKVAKGGAFAGDPVTTPEDTAEKRAEFRRDVAPPSKRSGTAGELKPDPKK